jgi:hypothetical protein
VLNTATFILVPLLSTSTVKSQKLKVKSQKSKLLAVVLL